MASIITLTFTGQPSIDDAIAISRDYRGDEIKQTFKSLRGQNFQSTIGGNLEDTILNLQDAFQADFALLNLTYQASPTELVISAENENNIFDNFLNESSDINVAVENTPIVEGITITDLSLSEADENPCDNIKITVTTNINMGWLIVGGFLNIEIDPKATTYSFDYPKILGNPTITVAEQFNQPPFSLPQTIDIPNSVVIFPVAEQTLTGVTVVVTTFNSENVAVTYAFRLQGSGDALNYQPSNTFTGLLSGTYEFWVKDEYGCEKVRTLTITNEADALSAPPFIYVPLINMIYFKEINDLKLNNENTLSYELNNQNRFQHELSKDQNIWIQYQSSYKNNMVQIFQCGELVEQILPSKLTSNIGYKDIRDGEIFSFNSKLAVMYNGGNIYDDQNNVVDQSNLFGQLLFDQVAGNLVNVQDFGTLPISQVVIDTSIGTFMLFDSVYTGNGATKKITFQYNIEDYEIFEFNKPTLNLEGPYQIVIYASNEDFIDFTTDFKYVSEVVNVSDLDLSEYFTLKYWNKENNEIAWQSGIQPVINMPKEFDNIYNSEEENDVFTTDTRNILLDAQNNQVFSFHLKLLPMNIARQISEITSNDQLQLDGLSYIKEEQPDLEPLIDSDLYRMVLRLTKTKGFANNSRRGINDLQISGNGLLSNQNGFLEL